MKKFRDFLNEEMTMTDEEKNKEKLDKERDKIEGEIFNAKVKKLNNILATEGQSFSFDIKKVEDHYEFNIPINILFGAKTREFCANRWKQVMAKADIDMDFSDEINTILEEFKRMTLTMKINKPMTKEIGQGEINKE